MDIKKWLLELVAELISQYLTVDIILQWEQAVKKKIYELAKAAAASTKWTQIDDNAVKKLGQAWKII